MVIFCLFVHLFGISNIYFCIKIAVVFVVIRYEYFYDNDSWKKVGLVQWSPIFQYMENDRHRNRQIAGNRSVIHMMSKPVEHVEVYIGDVFLADNQCKSDNYALQCMSSCSELFLDDHSST